MSKNRKITAYEVSRRRFWQLKDILDSGILGGVVISFGSGMITYYVTSSPEAALKIIGGVYFCSVWLNKAIKNAKKKNG